MKIKELEIVGFKSFVDRTLLRFDHQVTGIVGPNGCGKSNVVDAIRWAMGEQSAKHLRGRAMEDVIFNGSEARGPHGMAEVTITFDNTDGLAPAEYADYAEISVTRRLDRQGNSDYLINRTPVRLLDVTNLFLGTGVGRRAYSIIEQGRIGYIVSSKPEDRRIFIEEAAGITRFKARKRAAERKMDQTRQNLLRVGDIVAEIEKNLSSLKRQSQRAERYRAYRTELSDLELLVATHRWLELTVTERVVTSAHGEASTELEGVRQKLSAKEAELERQRLELATVEAQVDQAQARAYECDNAVQLLEGQIQQHQERLRGLQESERLAERELTELAEQRQRLREECETAHASLGALAQTEGEHAEGLAAANAVLDQLRERSEEAEAVVAEARTGLGEAETRLARAEAVLASFERRRTEAHSRYEKLVQERDGLGQRLEALADERAGLEARMQGLRQGREQQASQKEDLEAELTQLRAAIQESDRDVERYREQLTGSRSRLKSLQQIQQRLEGVGVGVRSVVNHFARDAEHSRKSGVLGLLGDRLECAPELTHALAAALGAKLEYVVVDGVGSAVDALAYLREQGRGRATLIPRSPGQSASASSANSQLSGERLSGEQWAAVMNVPGVLGRLGDSLGFDEEDRALVVHLLGDVVLVDSLEIALRLWEQGSAATWVTKAGEVLRPDGSITGGADDDAGAHRLEVQHEIRVLEGQVAERDEQLGKAVARHGELRRGIVERQGLLDAARTEAHDAELVMVRAEQELHRLDAERERVDARLEQLAQELKELQSGLALTGDEEAETREEIEAAEYSRVRAEQSLQAAAAVFGERREGVEVQAAKVTECSVQAAQSRERSEALRSTHERLLRSIDELDARESRLQQDVTAGAEQQEATVQQITTERERLDESVQQASHAQEAARQERDQYEQRRAQLSEHELVLRELRGGIDALSTRVNELTIEQRELAMGMEHLLSQVQERQRVDLRHVVGDYHARETPDDSHRSRIDELIRLIERMGEINLMAIEEYQEQSQRHEQLSAQQTDLEDALGQLDQAIRKMNRESRRMFKEAFEAVNERFKQVFPSMFGGGRAELRLTDPEQLLETGIDIVAQPPGKRLGNLELMSGGEKALTAVSLIFALFQYRPSPFCLLDEVDAPLDEANIGRFAEAVRQMTDRSQFIIITHAKRTMEYTDVLYGVTMEQPGISNLVAVELREQAHQTEAAKPPVSTSGEPTERQAAVA